MKDSNKLRNEILYQVFVRQYGKNHAFCDVYNDLDRIKELGANIIYLMPIFPIGKINRKGTIGSPYSIYNYDEVDEYLGGKDELLKLIDMTHKKGMKIIVDLVLNHTSCDATLLQENPDLYYHKNGVVGRKCEDWSDVMDLDYSNDLTIDIITKKVCNILKYGFDGFRMDVCSLIPMKFWRHLYKEMIKINPDVIMIGESVEKGFLEYIQSLGIPAPTDKECYEVFDALYQYDINKSFIDMKETKLKTLDIYLNDVLKQNEIFDKPKLRYLENHDIPRIASYDIKKLDVLHALNYFLPGMVFIYAGEEYGIKDRPDLFELDPICFKDKENDYSKLFKKLGEIRKLDYFYINDFKIEKMDDDLYILSYKNKNHKLYGVFNFKDERRKINIGINKYHDLINDLYIDGNDLLIDNYLIIEA